MSKDIDNIVRSAFDGESKEPAPGMVWSAINEELSGNEVDAVVKESFESQQDTAPELVWERVQDQLDIDRVWLRIANKISIRKYGYFLRYVAALLVLIIPFNLDVGFSFIETELPASRLSAKSVIVRSNEKVENKTLAPEETRTTTIPVNLIQPEIAPPPSLENPDNGEQLASLHLPKNIALEQVDMFVSSTELTPANFNIPPHKAPKLKRSVGLMIGVVGSLNNTWILDNETRAGFDAESLVENEFTLGTNYGMFVEYQLKPQWSVSAEYLIQSRTNQRTNFYDNGIYSQKEREINTSKVALMAVWNSRPKFLGVNHSTLIKFGGYYSRVKSDLTHINGFITNVNSVYQRSDVGLRLEAGKRIYLKSFVIDGGFRAHYGLANLASEKSNIPSQLNFTRLVSGGIYMRVAYTF